MEQYRVYDRQTLAYIDGGVVKDYSLDFDYLSNNASTIIIVEETYAKKGDILAVIKGTDKLFLGCITAVDNTKKTVSFKHMKELFNDKIINVFKYSGIIGTKFEAVGGIKTILEMAFVNIEDTQRRLPIKIITQGTTSGAVWTDESETLNVLDFLDAMFDNHNIYLNFHIDFAENKIVVSVIKNISEGKVIKDNLILNLLHNH